MDPIAPSNATRWYSIANHTPSSPSEDIIILNESPPAAEKKKAVHVPTLRELEQEIHQLVGSYKIISEETLSAFCSKLGEALQKEPCIFLEHYQVRIVQLTMMLKEADKLVNGETICARLKEYLLRTEQAARSLYRNSQTPVQDSLWPLFERILRLPSLEPDFFGAAIAQLNEMVAALVNTHPIVGQLRALLPDLVPPSHHFWQQAAPYNRPLKKLETVREKAVLLLHRLQKIGNGRIRDCRIPLKAILNIYRNFSEEFTKASEEKKKQLCIPKAQLSGVGLAFFLLDAEVARNLLSRDITGKECKRNVLGTHAVHHEAGVFYKPNSDNPNHFIHPEKEFAIYALDQRVGGNGIAPTALAKISHLFFEGQLHPHERILQAGYGIEGFSLNDFLAIANVLPFLNKCLGEDTAQEAFQWLLEENWQSEFLETHPGLFPDVLETLSPKKTAKIIFDAFTALFNKQAAAKRCQEFSEGTSLEVTKKGFENESCCSLVGCLALLSRYPDLAITSSQDRERRSYKIRPVSYVELITLQNTMIKIRNLFPTHSTQELYAELSKIMNSFESTNFSTHFVATLLTSPHDHRADNLMVTWSQNVQGSLSFSLVGIDNDLAFTPHVEQVRTMLYLLEPMNHPFDPEVAKELLKTIPEELVIDWLIALEEQNISYKRWQKATNVNSLELSIKVDSSHALSMYAKATRLWPLLNSSLSHWELLQKCQDPILAKVYKDALRFSDNPTLAYDDVGYWFRQQNIVPASIETEMVTIDTAAMKFLESINLGSFSIEQQVSLIGKVLNTFPRLGHRWSIYQNSAQSSDFFLPNADGHLRRQFFLRAVEQGHLALVARLLSDEKTERSNGTDNSDPLMEVRNLADETPLLMSCAAFNLDMTRLLMYHGANAQACNTLNQGPLIVCIKQFAENPEKVATLVRFLVDQPEILLNATDKDGWSVLHHLVKVANEPCPEAETLLAFLINKGAYPDLVDNHEKTPLDHAIEQGQDRWVMQLINLRASRIHNFTHACAFFKAHPNLKKAYTILQKQSLMLRWHLALETLSTSSIKDANYVLESASVNMGLSPELCKKLLDVQGNILHQNQYGNRNVCQLTLNNNLTIFFKQYPEMPGIEAAVGELLQLLIGHGTSLTDLAKLTDVKSKKSYPVLLAQGIRGDNLHDVLSDPVKRKNLENLDHLAFSELLCASLLVNLEDAKPDNFIMESLPDGTYRLISIDNDHAFVPPLLRTNEKIVSVKSILFCLDQMMQRIHPRARERFLSLNPDLFLELWLNRLCKRNNDYCTLFPEGVRRDLFQITSQNPGVVIPIPIKAGALTDIYQKFQRLQTALQESTDLSGMELLRLVIPPLGTLYEEAFWKYPTPLERFKELTHTQYTIAKDNRFLTIVNSREILKSMLIPDRDAWEKVAEQGTERALKELGAIRKENQKSAQELQTIRNELQGGNVEPFNELNLDTVREKVVNGIPGAFKGINFKTMRTNGSADLTKQRKVLSTILKGNYRSMRFLGCDAFDQAALKQLLSNSPQLISLEFDSCPQITENLLETELRDAKYLVRLKLSNLSQLKQLNLPHPNLRHLGIVGCQSLTRLTISHSLNSLSLNRCLQLSSVQTMLYEVTTSWSVIWGKVETVQFTNKPPNDTILQRLRLKDCPKFHPWWKWFGTWLNASADHEISLKMVPLNPDNKDGFSTVVRACLKHPEGIGMLCALFDCWKLPFDDAFKQIIAHDHSIGQLTAFLKYHKVSLNDLFSLYDRLDIQSVHKKHRKKLRNEFFSSLLSACSDPLPIKADSLNLEVLQQIETPEDLHRELRVILSAFEPNFKSVRVNENADDMTLQIIGERVPQLASINLSKCKQITKAGLGLLTQHCWDLTSINLNFCQQITDEELKHLAYHCEHLTSIALAACDKITDKGLQEIITYCLELTSIDIRLCKNISLPSMAETLAKDCRELKSVSLLYADLSLKKIMEKYKRIQWKYSDTEEKGLQLLAQEQPSFRVVDFPGSLISDSTLIALAKGSPRMISINLGGCPKITDVGLAALVKSCPELTRINLAGCAGITAGGYLSALILNRHVKIDTNIECKEIEAVLEPLRRKNNFSALDLSLKQKTTDEILKALVHACPGLKEVSLSSCTRLTDVGLEALHRCPHLQKVNLSKYWRFTQNGLLDFFHNNPQLMMVDISHSKVSDAALWGLARCPRLTHLNLSNCFDVTSSGLSVLAKKCPQLTFLNVSKLATMTDAVLYEFAKSCSKLEELNLSNCTQITASGLWSLVGKCLKLGTINLEECNQINENDLEKLRNKYPAIEFVRTKPKVENNSGSFVDGLVVAAVVIGLALLKKS